MQEKLVKELLSLSNNYDRKYNEYSKETIGLGYDYPHQQSLIITFQFMGG
jgi:hypothetical protein